MRAATITAHGRAPEVLDRADPVAADGPAARRRHRGADHARWTCSAPRAPPTSAPPPAALRAGRAGRRGGARRPARARRPAGLVPHHRRHGAGRRGDGRAGRRERRGGRGRRGGPARRRPWQRSACRRSPRGRCSRPGPPCAPARPCSCSGPAGSWARWRCRRRACSVPAAWSPPPARPLAQERAAACGADAVVDLGPDDDVASLAERLRSACGGGVDVVVDPLAGIPGLGRRPGARGRRTAGQPGQQRRAGGVGRLRRPAQPLGGGARLHQQLPHRRAPTGGVRDGAHPRGGRPHRRDAHRRPPATGRLPPGTTSPRAARRSGWSSPPRTAGRETATGAGQRPAPVDRPPQRRRRSVPVTVWPVSGTVTVTV